MATSLEFLTAPPHTAPIGNDAETFTRASGEESANALPPSGTVPFGQRTIPPDSTPAGAANCLETIL